MSVIPLATSCCTVTITDERLDRLYSCESMISLKGITLFFKFLIRSLFNSLITLWYIINILQDFEAPSEYGVQESIYSHLESSWPGLGIYFKQENVGEETLWKFWA